MLDSSQVGKTGPLSFIEQTARISVKHSAMRAKALGDQLPIVEW